MTTYVAAPPVKLSDSLPAGLPELVGNTPLLPLRSLTADLAPGVRIYAKAEWFNPGGSIKDRPALQIMRCALAEGKLGRGQRLLDATSGNTGIAYATFSAALGVPVTLAMPANASPERAAILRALGAELILTDPAEGADGAIRTVLSMAEDSDRYFHANQYDNPANWHAHYLTTGPEIAHQTGGSLTHFIAGMGTSGTMTGVGRFLRQYSPQVQLVAVQPDSPMHGMEGFKHMATAILPGIYDPSLPDRVIEVRTEDAHEMALRLARQEGLFVGVSAAANALAAHRLAQGLESGLIVTVFPDSGYKYLSDTKLWKRPL
jgi:S-sulfo-L-cysteine synthase (O-acetyl-L-serine-dependent)